MVPLRNALIVKEHGILPYPEGQACAEVLLAGEEGGANASTVFAGMGIAAAFKFVIDGLKAVPSEVSLRFKGFAGEIGTQIYPAVMSVGYICGPKISSYMFAGGVVSWMVLIPLIVLFGGSTILYPGTATITVTTSNGKTATCEVTVKLPFYDVNAKKWYYNYAIEAYKLGLMTGTTDTTFEPDGNMTRGMVAVVMHRIAGSPAYTFRTIFPDVQQKKYCATAITWAYDNEIITGFKSGENAGKFLPDGNITRQDLALILYRYATSLGIDTSSRKDISGFVDSKQVSKYAKEAMQWVTSVGIITGTKENELKPQANATRAECAKMLVEFYNLINK